MRTVFASSLQRPRALGAIAAANLLVSTLAPAAPAPLPAGQAALASAPPLERVNSDTSAGTPLTLRTVVVVPSTDVTRVALEQGIKRHRLLRAEPPRSVPTTLMPAGGAPPPPPPPPPATEVVRAPLVGQLQPHRTEVSDTSRGTALTLRLLPDELPSEQMLASAPRRRYGIDVGADTSRGTPRPLAAQFSATSVAGRLRFTGLDDAGKFSVAATAGAMALRGASSFVPQGGAITDVAGVLYLPGAAGVTKIGLTAPAGRVGLRAASTGQNFLVPTYDLAGALRLLGASSGYKLGIWSLHGRTTGQRRPAQGAGRRRPKQS